MKRQNGEANKLQDGANKRNINADAKFLAVFGKPQVTMFELAGIVGKHLEWAMRSPACASSARPAWRALTSPLLPGVRTRPRCPACRVIFSHCLCALRP